MRKSDSESPIQDTTEGKKCEETSIVPSNFLIASTLCETPIVIQTGAESNGFDTSPTASQPIEDKEQPPLM